MIEAAAPPLAIVRTTHDSPAGRWTMASCPPRPPRGGLVAGLWAVRGQATYTVERIVPAGSIELMITLGPVHHLLDASGRAVRRLTTGGPLEQNPVFAERRRQDASPR
jgi:hypothetical protein